MSEKRIIEKGVTEFPINDSSQEPKTPEPKKKRFKIELTEKITKWLAEPYPKFKIIEALAWSLSSNSCGVRVVLNLDSLRAFKKSGFDEDMLKQFQDEVKAFFTTIISHGLDFRADIVLYDTDNLEDAMKEKGVPSSIYLKKD